MKRVLILLTTSVPLANLIETNSTTNHIIKNTRNYEKVNANARHNSYVMSNTDLDEPS